jgi:predicted DNA-binding protein (UPF0251 family)
MKKLTAKIVAILIFSTSYINAQNNGAEMLKQFVKDIPALQAENLTTIDGLNEASKKKASKTIDLTKDNIAEAFKDAQGKICIIVVENHTIVKFADLKKCNVSGSWGVCMPYGEGFIQKGELTGINDFINNIIGKPDTQKRTLFIF